MNMSNPLLAKIGMSREGGQQIDRKAHINQSIADIVTTPIGTRLQRREYGSHLFDLIDSAGNEAGVLRMLAAVIDAINKWEPRICVESASLKVNKDGTAVLYYDYYDRLERKRYENATLLLTL